MAGIDAFGTTWSIGNDDGPPETFTPVADVVNIDIVDVKAETIDVSSHDSPGGWREFVSGPLKDGGELSMEINYDPAEHGTLFATIGVTRNMKIVLPDTGAT